MRKKYGKYERYEKYGKLFFVKTTTGERRAGAVVERPGVKAAQAVKAHDWIGKAGVENGKRKANAVNIGCLTLEHEESYNHR